MRLRDLFSAIGQDGMLAAIQHLRAVVDQLLSKQHIFRAENVTGTVNGIRLENASGTVIYEAKDKA